MTAKKAGLWIGASAILALHCTCFAQPEAPVATPSATPAATPSTPTETPTVSVNTSPTFTNTDFSPAIPGGGIPEQQFRLVDPTLFRDNLNPFRIKFDQPHGPETQDQPASGVTPDFSGGAGGAGALLPLEVELLQGYGGGFTPRVDRGEFLIIDGTDSGGSGGTGNNGGGGGTTPNGLNAKVLPPVTEALPAEAQKYFLARLKVPKGSGSRNEAERALSNLDFVPQAIANQMFTVPTATKTMPEKSRFYGAAVKQVAALNSEFMTRRGSRLAVIVAPAGADAKNREIRNSAKSTAMFQGTTADTLLTSAFSTGKSQAKVLNSGLGSGGQVWFVDGAEDVLPNVASAVAAKAKISDNVAVLSASRNGAKILSASPGLSVESAVKFYARSISTQANVGSAATAAAAKAVVEGVGPQNLVGFAPDAATAQLQARAIRSNRRFATDAEGQVVILLQSEQGTELFSF